MRGKIYKYDPPTQKMVLVSDPNEIHLLPVNNESSDQLSPGLAIMSESCPVDKKTGELTAEHKNNLKQIFRKTDALAEKEKDRRDCLKIQRVVQRMRERYGIDE